MGNGLSVICVGAVFVGGRKLDRAIFDRQAGVAEQSLDNVLFGHRVGEAHIAIPQRRHRGGIARLSDFSVFIEREIHRRRIALRVGLLLGKRKRHRFAHDFGSFRVAFAFFLGYVRRARHGGTTANLRDGLIFRGSEQCNQIRSGKAAALLFRIGRLGGVFQRDGRRT